MRNFLNKHAEKITGTISCFDRLLFKGYLPLTWPEAMEQLMAGEGLKIKEFKNFVFSSSERLKDHAKAMAQLQGRSYLHLSRPVRKEDLAKEIAERDGITEGLVCLLSAVESCQSFAVVPGKGRPKIVHAERKCLCLYYYFLDPELGFLHVRVQTWFPFTVQICLNGHEWLARKLKRHGIDFQLRDNAFLWLENPERAQRLANRFVKKNWLKMYDKHGCVLRVETVINRPYEFKVRRWGIRKGERVVGWFPMAKGVFNLYRYAEVSLSANKRYIDALAEVNDPTDARIELHKASRPRRVEGRSYRGFNPASPDDVALFESVLRGEHAIQGFRNSDIRPRLFSQTKDTGERRRQSAYISRLLKRLHVHGLIAKIPRSRRWQVTHKGLRIMGAALEFYQIGFFEARQKICDNLRKSA